MPLWLMPCSFSDRCRGVRAECQTWLSRQCSWHRNVPCVLPEEGYGPTMLPKRPHYIEYSQLFVIGPREHINWLRMLRRAEVSRISHDVEQQLHTQAVQSDTCLVLRSSMWDGHVSSVACYMHHVWRVGGAPAAFWRLGAGRALGVQGTILLQPCGALPSLMTIALAPSSIIKHRAHSSLSSLVCEWQSVPTTRRRGEEGPCGSRARAAISSGCRRSLRGV
jgi:hypothetical protein